MKKEYLFLINGDGLDGLGGGERHQIDYFKSIDHEKYSVILATSAGLCKHFKTIDLPIKLVLLPSIEAKDGFLKKFIKYYKFFKIYKPNCVIMNQYWLKSFSLPELMAASLISKGNAVMIVHDNPPLCPSYESKLFLGFIPGLGLSWRKERLLQTILGYLAKYTIAVSKTVKNTLVTLHRFPESKVKIIYHGTDINKFFPSPEIKARVREEYHIVDNDLIIISTAAFRTVKRVDRLIDAFAILAEEKNNIYLFILGDGPEKEKIISQVKSFSDEIQKRIKLLGYQENIAKFLQMSDIYVLPSDSEGLPLACLEAISCGLLAISTQCGGCVEIIKDGENGFFVEKNTQGILNGLKRVLNLTTEQKIQIRESSLNYVASQFNIKTNIQNGLKVLKLD